MNYIIRDDKEHETTAPKVKVIAPRKKFQPSYNDRQNRKKRVGAYCRVSTDSDEQELSYETQCEYYENHIGSHENWELVAIYSDEGITGTSTNKRSDFMRMIDDARAGQLDMIITKSITRFARNTVDSLMYLRILKEYNVDVYFEVENVHSLEANEMLLTILSSVAQQSSEDKSESIKWGYQRQFEKGKVYAANMYGYKSNRGTLDIIEEEAEVVREIFSKYLSGMSESKIARYLTENKVPKKNGSTKWDSGTIGRMLQNEKYSGDALLKKTFSIDFLHKKRYKNEGQKKMYFVENSHPAIVTKEVFKAAQVERTKRNMKSNDEAEVVREIFSKYLSGMSESKIARYLTENKVPKKNGSTKWDSGTIGRMLQNEKYSGDALLKKTFSIDFLHKKRYKNEGQKKMYFVENSHPAIVTKEVFKAAQVERTKRNMKSNDEKEVVESHHQNRYSSKNPLSNKIICSECGALYRRAVWTKRNKEKEPVWRCSNRLKNGNAICPNSVTLKEKPLLDALTSLINGKTKSKEKTRLELAKELSEYLNPKDIIEKKQKLNCELENVNSQINELLDKGMLLVARGVQDESQIEEHLAQCYQTKQMLKKELQKLDDKYNALKQGRQEKLLKTLEKNSNEYTVMTQEDLAVFIDRIIVKKDKIEIETIDDQKCELLLNQIS